MAFKAGTTRPGGGGRGKGVLVVSRLECCSYTKDETAQHIFKIIPREMLSIY